MFVNGEFSLFFQVHVQYGARRSRKIWFFSLHGGRSRRSSDIRLRNRKASGFFETRHQSFTRLCVGFVIVNFTNDNVSWHGESRLRHHFCIKEGVDVDTWLFWRLLSVIKIMGLALHFGHVGILNILCCERLQRKLHV